MLRVVRRFRVVARLSQVSRRECPAALKLLIELIDVVDGDVVELYQEVFHQLMNQNQPLSYFLSGICEIRNWVT